MNKIVTMLLAAALLGTAMASTSCARRTTQERKTRAFQRHHKPGDRMPCPTHDC
ncbi:MULTISPECIES: hypothetical protein [Hymenobacter]|uniref:hypothetical protein n=1 Tax=Hymenobacter TaxID=89966 RepID=UPI0013FCFED0|nr:MULTISPECIES: hypothetical protein [Hymenobacter]MBC6988147.1 hypothetical protein [Hymenobacter sp. BT491]